jgi:septal ring factor EnvC (AmiA/AmiB activator)
VRLARSSGVAALLVVIARHGLAGPDFQTPGDIESKRRELRQLETGAEAARSHSQTLAGAVADLAAAREKLKRRLLDATTALQQTETQAAEIETRLATLTQEEKKLADALAGRRDDIAKILTILQRMGRKPPPALLTQPQDMLDALRGGQALETALAPIRAQASALQADLTALVNLRRQLGREQARLAEASNRLKAQREELALTIEARQREMAGAQNELTAENDRARLMARQTTTLKELIRRLDAHGVRQPDAGREQETTASPGEDVGRLAPVVAFRDLKGKLHLPAVGAIVRRYGAPNVDGVEKGVSIATRENAIVVAPSDGRVSYAGAWRNYGQLLIINAGGGYYVVLAGMKRASVNVGQFVLAGEPVAVMGDGSAQTTATIAIGASKPILYVEFRKDGSSIDPGPWWAMSSSRKGGG